jgi:hypothetical protein
MVHDDLSLIMVSLNIVSDISKWVFVLQTVPERYVLTLGWANDMLEWVGSGLQRSEAGHMMRPMCRVW